jgi:SH3-like domain-containing protein
VFEPAFEGPIPAGTEARIVEDRDGWARLRLIDGRECWLPRSAVEAVDPL